MKTDKLYRRFREVFGSENTPTAYRAPGRVNLIGEHTDYNDGLVLPIAIDLSTYALIAVTDQDRVRLFSENLDQLEEFGLEDVRVKQNDWTDYVRGIVAGFMDLTDSLQGFDLYINSEVPVGSGLSSSAALEISTAVGLRDELQQGNLGDLELIKLCQRAENEFVGANTGIMDQYVSYFARAGAGLLIDTSKPSHEQVELDTSGYELLVIDTRVSHTHGGSEYNERRRECEKALREINRLAQGETKYASLSRIPPSELETIGPRMEEKLWKRAKHVIEENGRVKEAAELLGRNEIGRAGKLFYDSHESLRDLYQVSAPELDFLVGFAREEGIPGARMTGGGFGGATIHLVPEEGFEEYRKGAEKEFKKEFGHEPKCFNVTPSDGALVRPTPAE